MFRRNKILFSIICLLLLASVQQVSANSHSFDLLGIDASVTKIEYSLVPEPWTPVSVDSKRIDVGRLGTTEDTLLVRLYTTASKYVGEYRYHWDESLKTWVYVPPVAPFQTVATTQTQAPSPRSLEKIDVMISPYTTLLLTDKNVRYMYTLPVGVGVDISLSFPFHRDLIFSADVEVSYAKSNNIWADSFIIFGADVGVGYRFHLGERFLLTPSILYGVFFQYGFKDVILDASLFMTHHISANVEVGYQINNNMHVFGAPQVQMMIDGSGYGFLYGLRAGVGFVL